MMNPAISTSSKMNDRKPEGLAAWLLRRLKTARRKGSAEPSMDHLETLSLGGRRQLMLVECDGQRYLVGCGAESIHSIVPVVQSGIACEGQR